MSRDAKDEQIAMKVAYLAAPQAIAKAPLRIEEVQMPEPGPEQVLL